MSSEDAEMEVKEVVQVEEVQVEVEAEKEEVAADKEEATEEAAEEATEEAAEEPKKTTPKKAPKKAVVPPSSGRRSARESKKPEVFTIDRVEAEEKDLVVPDGSGEGLGKIDNVEQRLSMTKAVDPLLKKLHQLIFPGQKGNKLNIKKHIRLFKGFGKADLETTKAKTREKLETFEAGKILKPLCLLLDVDQAGTKEEMMDRIVTFLVKPVSSGKEFKKATMKRKATKTKSSKKKVAKKEKVAKAMSGYMFFSNAKRESVKKKNPDATFAEMAKLFSGLWGKLDDEAKEDWKQKAIDSFNAGGGKKEKKSSKKAKAPKKKKQKKDESTEEEEEEEEEESDDDAPLAVKAKGLGDKIESRIKEILKDADLNNMSIKKIRTQLSEEFDADLIASKKAEIKEFVNTILSD